MLAKTKLITKFQKLIEEVQQEEHVDIQSVNFFLQDHDSDIKYSVTLFPNEQKLD